MSKPKAKYLQRPSNVELQHMLIRDVPKSLVRQFKRKLRAMRPPTTIRWGIIALMERYVEGVNLTADSGNRPPTVQPEAERPIEQTF